MSTTDSSEMQIKPQRAKQLIENLNSVITKVRSVGGGNCRLVAVSKLKPANDILALYQAPHPQLHFGENYQQELLAKSQILPREICWHFIGALQTNKCRPLAEQVPNLWCVESVDASKKADQLDKGRCLLWERLPEYADSPLRVFVQVNTSGEEEKSGVKPEEATELCRHIREQCSHLKLQGLMTIGALARSKGAIEGAENEDFVVLKGVRDTVAQNLALDGKELELSMGMSQDFESAIRCGSDEVRVGSVIFGERPKKEAAQIQVDNEDVKS